jgi:hypothetical protein
VFLIHSAALCSASSRCVFGVARQTSMAALFSASFFLNHEFAIAERGLFLAESEPPNNHP